MRKRGRSCVVSIVVVTAVSIVVSKGPTGSATGSLPSRNAPMTDMYSTMIKRGGRTFIIATDVLKHLGIPGGSNSPVKVYCMESIVIITNPEFDPLENDS
jgi:hypothetical protein